MLSPQFFPCPNCGETIGSGASTCRYCHTAVDPMAAAAAANLQQRINQACNDASLARNIAGFTWIAVLIQFINLVGGRLIFFGLMIAAPVMLFNWWRKYRHIVTNDVDFKVAKRNWEIGLLLWAPTPFLFLALAAWVFRP